MVGVPFRGKFDAFLNVDIPIGFLYIGIVSSMQGLLVNIEAIGTLEPYSSAVRPSRFWTCGVVATVGPPGACKIICCPSDLALIA